jgi:hypothetical protein
MEQFLKVGELERESLAEQDSVILLPQSINTHTFYFLFAMISCTLNISFLLG